MISNETAEKIQENICIQSKIDNFFKQFKIVRKMWQCGIRKRHGHSVQSLAISIFILPFLGRNFYRGIVLNDELPFSKDAAYDLLKGDKSNWRRLLLLLGTQLFHFFNRLTNEDRESVLIVDDSIYDRSRSKSVELLSRVWDHSTGRFLLGFRMLTMCWSDGRSCLPLDFALLSSTDEKKRISESRKKVDKRSSAWQRRKEATIKATAHLKDMVSRIQSSGIKAKYLLMDSWFTMPATVSELSKLIEIIGMVKKTPKIRYNFNGQWMDIKSIYNRLKKRRGRAKFLAETIVTLKDGTSVKLVFVRDRRKKDWLALLSTKTDLSNEKIIQIYGKRWDIEVFFKIAKQNLKLAKEIQSRDFDALIAHTSIVFMRYMFLAYQNRIETDHRTFGELFYSCCDELADISFVDALYRLLNLVVEKIRNSQEYCKDTAIAFFDTIIEKSMELQGVPRWSAFVRT